MRYIEIPADSRTKVRFRAESRSRAPKSDEDWVLILPRGLAHAVEEVLRGERALTPGLWRAIVREWLDATVEPIAPEPDLDDLRQLTRRYSPHRRVEGVGDRDRWNAHALSAGKVEGMARRVAKIREYKEKRRRHARKIRGL